ncbi:Mis6-domain-containing protein [Gilbertella persicaria]|uniref:Mis6-domain-containing protein n=1 Tax=Gilbertella persicaria TaxID=101096 RepID=UPI00221F35E8|nr:Mis6-domain-containing protein [Gilbertella persicaria]KAI8066934.1 Mis6-domain-containing protein [Gilbertella persicaria]
MIMSFSLGPSMSRGLVQLLLPRDDIADDYIIRIIGSVSQRDQNLGVLAELLKWTIAVFDVISDKQRLNHLYHVFFRHLHYEELRRSLCHLLYFLTKKEHVTKYRVTRLKEMIDAERDNAELIALLLVYQTYDASINVPHNVRLADMLVFRNPLPQVKHNLTNLRILWKNDIQFKTDIIKGEIRLPTMKRVRMSKKKRLEQATEEARKELSVVDVSDVINSVDHVGLSDQLSMVLQKRSLQYALLYDPEGTAVTRLSYYIVQILFDLLIYGNKKDTGKQELGDMLRTLVRFTRFTKTQLPAVQIFLYRYLKTWNGYEYEDEILTLITYLKPASFKELSEYILKPLCRLYVASDVKWKSKLILCYTEWLKNWAALDWKQHVRLRKEASDTSIDHLTSLFGKLSFDVNYFRTIQKFVEHVDKLCVSGLLAEDDHVLMQHAGLTFFELVAQISRQDDIPDIIIPAATFVHRNFFSTTAMAVSRICGIIHQYKVAFEENDRKTIDWSSKHTQEYLEHFNTYMMDICNSLWRNLGLSQSKENEQAFSFTE